MAMDSDFLAAPKRVPSLGIPPSNNAVTVRIIDSTSQLRAHAPMILEPAIPGHDLLQCPAYSFLIEHPSGRKILYDLGTRKDWENLPPLVQGLLKHHDLAIEVEKNVAEILQENGIAVTDGEIEALIWSHWHYDHIGDPSTFPGSTALVVGPGFKAAFLPGYPENKDSAIRQSDYEGRELRELEFDASQARIGGLQFHDYFGDGSFYILNAPGHAVGHLCALARVTATGSQNSDDDTFIFMGGDSCHHGGEFRPTEYLPLPKQFDPSPFPVSSLTVCPGSWLQAVHYERRADKPFYTVKKGFSHNDEDCQSTISRVTEFDGVDNVLVVIAHDPALLQNGFPMFPASANNWKDGNFGDRLRWCFLQDFQLAVESANK
ncbi:hypothetical protein A1O7_05193 [Cladophialophora yegresii CBS 114405]|uniref:Metallo-beta-lactamase domain-containing protein n=1 Tax=Cladophialophora yegresii CBS 114405 TaxID=1182544 RepID=W9W7R9_9EURO|nr:uncharacterized protein A1O7_05193 [Cladophialophora yegresii CBS 114405]EXJ61040.1 hypothetical protein A1O7_05193 [Cladophialophora yegresii CBS 114405]